MIVVTFYPCDTHGGRGRRSEVPLGQRVRGGASLLPQRCPLVDTSAGVGESPRPAAGLGEELDGLSPWSGQDGEASPEGALGPREHSERVHRCGMPPTSRGGHWLLGSQPGLCGRRPGGPQGVTNTGTLSLSHHQVTRTPPDPRGRALRKTEHGPQTASGLPPGAAGPKIQGPALLSGKRVRPLGEKDELRFLAHRLRGE